MSTLHDVINVVFIGLSFGFSMARAQETRAIVRVEDEAKAATAVAVFELSASERVAFACEAVQADEEGIAHVALARGARNA